MNRIDHFEWNLDKTIMEMQPEKARANGWILFEVRLNCGSYYCFCFRTGVLVEAYL